MNMNSTNKEPVWDAVVIGGGLAGLTASIYLARAGRKVVLLEKSPQTGGRAATKELGGARLNLGAHALYASALGILREVGVEPRGGSPKPGGPLVFKREGGETAVPLWKLLVGSFLAWPEKTELIRFYAQIRKTETSALQGISLQRYLEDRIRSPRVRNIAMALVRVSTYCDAPELASAGAAIDQLRHSSVLYVNGGWQTIADRLRAQAQTAGVAIRCGAAAREISGADPEMTVTLKDGTRLQTRRVLSTAGPKETLALLDAPLPAGEADAFSRLVPVYAACLDLVVAGLPQPKTTFSLGADRPWYFSNHSAAATFTDNPEHSVVHVMKYLPAGKDTDARQDERELERFLDLIQPGWRKHVVQRRFLPHMLVSNAVVAARTGGYAGRPGPVVEGRPGLYVAGDWVGSEGMLLNASLASAKEAAMRIIGDKEQNKEAMERGA